jgi:hypothetical protein
MKGVGCWFGSAPSGCGRAAHGGAWCGGASGEAAAARAFEGGRRPRVGQSGLRRPAGQLGRCEVFGPGEEGRV